MPTILNTLFLRSWDLRLFFTVEHFFFFFLVFKVYIKSFHSRMKKIAFLKVVHWKTSGESWIKL